jgi:hypothetical protein
LNPAGSVVRIVDFGFGGSAAGGAVVVVVELPVNCLSAG